MIIFPFFLRNCLSLRARFPVDEWFRKAFSPTSKQYREYGEERKVEGEWGGGYYPGFND